MLYGPGEITVLLQTNGMRPLSAPGDILSFAYTTTVGTSSSNSSSRPPSAALGAPPVPPSGRWSTESNLNISGLSQLNASQTSNQSISSILRQANQDMDYVGIAQDCSGSNTPTAQDKQWLFVNFCDSDRTDVLLLCIFILFVFVRNEAEIKSALFENNIMCAPMFMFFFNKLST